MRRIRATRSHAIEYAHSATLNFGLAGPIQASVCDARQHTTRCAKVRQQALRLKTDIRERQPKATRGCVVVETANLAGRSLVYEPLCLCQCLQPDSLCLDKVERLRELQAIEVCRLKSSRRLRDLPGRE